MKKKKFKDVNLTMMGKPCTPGKIKTISKEQFEELNKHIEEAKLLGKAVVETNQRVTEHEYLDHMIKENEHIENYEECARLLKLKNETPYNEELTRIITTFSSEMI